MRTIYGLMVTKNEEGRYLERMLIHANTVVDHMFVYDDHSEDDTAEMCAHYGATVVVRAQHDPSFTENEGAFRQNAWKIFSQGNLDDGDWVLALDADEFPVMAVSGSPKIGIHTAIERAEVEGAGSVRIRFKEIWGLDPIVYRTDGFWDDIVHPRLFPWKPDTDWNNKQLGGGSWPEYVRKSPSIESHDLRILHYGYADARDRAEKYARYNQEAGAHSSKHIRSIMGKPTLVEWEGGKPCH